MITITIVSIVIPNSCSFGLMIKSVTTLNMSAVTKFCSDYAFIVWAILGLIILLLLVYIFAPCTFDIFSWESICKYFNSFATAFNQAVDVIDTSTSDCTKRPDCSCGCEYIEDVDDCAVSGSGQGLDVRGKGNVVVNLPAINVVVNGMSQDSGNGNIPPIIIPPISTTPPNCYQPVQQHGCSGSGNTVDEECEIIDSVYLCGKRYAITYLPGIIRVYDSNSSSILSIITHNLGVLRSIRYQMDKFVVEDSHSNEFEGVILNGEINFTQVS